MFGPNFLDDIDMDFCGDFFEQFDDLLDFPMEDIEETVDGGDCDGFQGVRPPPPENTPVGSADVLSGKNCDHSSSKLPTELSVPYEDIAQLEWLSNFVDDSYSTRTITVEKSSSNEPLKDNPCFHTSSPVSVLESSITTSTSSSSSSYPAGRTLPTNPTTFVPGRARSKRPRPATFNRRHVFPLISPTSSLTKPTTHFSAGSQSQSEFEDYEEFYPFKKIHEVGAVEQMKKKKKKKKLVLPSGATEQSAVPQTGTVRKCLHCEITKTPQWRAGPMGPKTLCNACGVRYKSGRLFPEYRPAASPTFVAALHSNSHKKVIEMRSKTTTAAVPELVPNSFPSVDYF